LAAGHQLDGAGEAISTIERTPKTVNLTSRIKLEHVACNFCGSSTHRIWRRVSEWTAVECQRCRFRFTNPRPTRDSLPAFYTEGYFQDERHRLSHCDANGSPLLDLPTGRYLNRVTDIEPWFEARGTLFEVGSARGAFLKVMRDRGWSVRGIDISADAAGFARNTYDVDVVSATPEEFGTSDRFNVVCMYQTLEHLPDPLHVLQKARTWLQPGGVLVIEVPNANSFDIRISRRQANLTLDLPRHLSHFTPSFLCGQLERLGFRVLCCKLYPPSPLVTLLQWHERARSRFSQPKLVCLPRPPAVPPLLPLARPPAETWKSRLIQRITSVAPGWRFTVVARTTALPP